MIDDKQKLYQKYFWEKLDIIFDSSSTNEFNNFQDEPMEIIPESHIKVLLRKLEQCNPDYEYHIKSELHNGYVIVERGYKTYKKHPYEYNFIGYNGDLVCSRWYGKVSDFSHGYAIVQVDANNEESANIINLRGKTMFANLGKATITQNFLIVGNDVYVKEFAMDDYETTKSVFGYKCSNGKDSYFVRFYPVKRFGELFTLCVDKKIVYIQNRFRGRPEKLGNIEDIQYNDFFIINSALKRVFFVYGNHDYLIDITDYYEGKLKNKKRVRIVFGEYIDTFKHFSTLNQQLIEELFSELRREKREKVVVKELAYSGIKGQL